MSFAEINGARIYYETAGAGKPLIMLHAGICDCRMWNNQFFTFATQRRVMRYDRRGFGKTDLVEGEYSHVEDLRALMDKLDIKSACLMGCSQGGKIAMDFTLQYPERVSALIMVTSNPGGYEFTGDTPELYEQIIEAFKAGDLERTSELETQFWVVGEKRIPKDVDPRIRKAVYAMNLIALRQEVRGIGDEIETEFKAVDRLAEIKVPTLVMVGEVDDYELVEAGELMQKEIPNATLVTIDGVAHLPNMEKPDEFNSAIEDFLKSL